MHLLMLPIELTLISQSINLTPKVIKKTNSVLKSLDHFEKLFLERERERCMVRLGGDSSVRCCLFTHRH